MKQPKDKKNSNHNLQCKKQKQKKKTGAQEYTKNTKTEEDKSTYNH